MNPDVLEYYAASGRFTDIDAPELVAGDLAAIVEKVQGLLVYDTVAEAMYGAELTSQQAATVHERDSARLLDAVRNVDGRPLDEARPPGHRVGARCHIYSRMTVASLRAAGVPARARCGFGTYFLPGFHEDHWVAEVWDAAESRWKMVDAQLDATWCDTLGFEGDPLDIEPTQFVTAGHAWQAWRRGDLDPDTCGLSVIDEHGSFWIAGNLRLDLAALNKVEMLPWDVWGAGWAPGDDPPDEILELFDSVAELTVDPDRHFDEVLALYERHDSLRMDGTVFNVERGALEVVGGS